MVYLQAMNPWTLSVEYGVIVINHLWHSAVVFHGDNITADGQVGGQWVIGHIVYSIVVYTVTLKVVYCNI